MDTLWNEEKVRAEIEKIFGSDYEHTDAILDLAYSTYVSGTDLMAHTSQCANNFYAEFEVLDCGNIRPEDEFKDKHYANVLGDLRYVV